MIRLALICLSAATLLVPSAQSQFATSVVAFNQGTGGGIFNTQNVLGGPQGGGFVSGSLDVLSLGDGGSVTLAFGAPIVNGPGADFIVFENGFEFPAGSFEIFSEVAYVEVSTNGVDFARFPSRYQNVPNPSGFTLPMGTFSNLTGGQPVLANVVSNSISPFDPTESGGEAFDLEHLTADPAVQSGLVNLGAINFVRIVDVVSGIDTDSFGNVIYDNSGMDGSADIDAVAVINDATTVGAGQPVVDLSVDSLGRLRIKLGDPDGLGDLDLLSIHLSANLVPISPTLIPFFYSVVSLTANEVELVSNLPVQGLGFWVTVAMSVKDLGGGFAASQVMIGG